MTRMTLALTLSLLAAQSAHADDSTEPRDAYVAVADAVLTDPAFRSARLSPAARDRVETHLRSAYARTAGEPDYMVRLYATALESVRDGLRSSDRAVRAAALSRLIRSAE